MYCSILLYTYIHPLDAMNTQVHDATGACPYELVFGQRAHAVIFPTQQSRMILEEDLADEGVEFSTDPSSSQYQQCWY